MYTGKFIDLSIDAQREHVQSNFIDQGNRGWFSPEGDFVGLGIDDVIRAIIDYEDAEINTIGDCMSGFCVTPPKLTDFVRKPD